MTQDTWRACCPHCQRAYIRRAYTEKERENPGLHLLTLSPMECTCGRTFVANEVVRWIPERL